MRRTMLLLSFILLFTVAAVAQGMEGGEKCKQCGMSRSMFSYSRMLLTYRGGAQSGVCSLHCAAADMARAPDKKGVALQVADYDTRQLIAAKAAVWVMGGSKSGVMTGEPKWAFASRAAAQRFVQQNGGAIVSFPQAMKAATGEIETGAGNMHQPRQARHHQGH